MAATPPQRAAQPPQTSDAPHKFKSRARINIKNNVKNKKFRL
jgi:hypothetical protein